MSASELRLEAAESYVRAVALADDAGVAAELWRFHGNMMDVLGRKREALVSHRQAAALGEFYNVVFLTRFIILKYLKLAKFSLLSFVRIFGGWWGDGGG